MRLSFIGGGAMAEAMIAGVIESGVTDAGSIRVGEPVQARRDYLRSAYSVEHTESNLDAASGADLIVLAVKPQQATAVLTELHGRVDPRAAVLSIVNGLRLDSLAAGLDHRAVIRVMPNTPAQIGAGMSVWTAAVSEDARNSARAILRSLGEEMYVSDEKLIDMATALSGCGPAYVFLFVEALIDAGVYVGMSRDMSRKLALQTVLGSARLLAESGRHPAELKDLVTSPAGATIEGVLALERGGVRAAVIEAVISAYEKSRALGEQK